MKKEILIPVLLLFLGLIFIIINLIVYFSKGNPWLISKKLKLGAMIITISGMFACGSPAPDIKTSTCYTPKPHDNKNNAFTAVKKKFKDSVVNAKEERQKNDSILKSKKKKKTPTVPPRMCYMVRK